MNPYSYSDKTAFTHTVTGNPYILQQGFSNEETDRVNNELLLWRFYKGHQWPKERVAGEPQNTINYCRAFVDKSAAFLMAKGFNIAVKPEALEIVKPILEEVWDDNSRELIGLDIAQSGGVSGNAWVKVAVEYFDEEELPDMYELYPNGRIRLIVLPSYAVFPSWHPHDKDRMIRCRIIYPIDIEEVAADGHIEIKRVWYREEITPTKIREYYNDELYEERDNALGEISVVRIKNLPLAGESLGLSDIQDIVILQKELNAKTTDVSDIINYHAAPITIIQGAKSTGLEKGARKIWGGLPKDAKVYNLELNSDLGAAMNYIELIKSAMFELGHMPEDAFGKKMSISNTTGVALHIKNQPLMETTRTKWMTYGEGIRQINRLILKYAELIEYPGFDIGKFKALKPIERYWSKAEFADPLPKDELMQMQLIAQKISLFLLSRKDALMELGETDAVKKLEEILQEAEDVQNRIYDAQTDTDNAMNTNIGRIVDRREKANSEEDD